MARTPKPSKGRSTDDDDNGTNTSDSDFPGSSSTPHSYTIPQWLIPEKQTVKYFAVKLPSVPKKLEEAIRTRLKKQYPHTEFKESTKMIHQITQLQHDEKQANHKVKIAKDKLDKALHAKTEGIDELKQSSEGETQRALESLEKSMRKDQEKEYRQTKEKIKALVRAEFDQKFEEELVKKRKREATQEEEEILRAKRQTLLEEQQHQQQDEAMLEEGEERPAALKGTATKTNSKVTELEKKREELQDKMEKLSEKKSEMFWLLKTVIMQETKQKTALKQKRREEAKGAA